MLFILLISYLLFVANDLPEEQMTSDYWQITDKVL